MSELAIGEGAAPSPTFRPRLMLLVVAVGILSFLAMLVLGAYAPDLRSGRNGGSHALSNAATGFSGLVKLAEATHRNPQIGRAVQQLDGEELVVLTPEDPSTNLTSILAQRGGKATLLIYPKWLTMRDQVRPEWVRVAGVFPVSGVERVLAPAREFTARRVKGNGRPLPVPMREASADMRFIAPPVTQTLSGKELVPIVTAPDGRIVLGRINQSQLYILADPDLVNNHGLADIRQARSAMAMLDFLNSTGAQKIVFDVTLNGLGSSRSPLRLAFDPPFLAVTLVLLTALLVAGLQGLVRFGPPLRSERAIAFGKAKLVENSGAIIRRARREVRLGHLYVDVVRRRAASLFRLPPSLKGDALDERLDRIGQGRSFSDAAAAVSAAQNEQELVAAARALNEWVEERKRDG
ncbi:MAG: hypothetical protein ABIQ32_12120 [Sphingomicrobium sp.]